MFEKRGNTFGEHAFGTNLSTLKFVLVSIATFSFYFYAWMYNLIFEANKKQQVKAVTPVIALVAAGVSYWSVWMSAMVLQFIIVEPDFASFLSTLSGLCSLVHLIILIYVSVKIRPVIQSILQKNNLYVPLNIVLTVIFPIVYQYYCLKNAEGRFAKKMGQAQNYHTAQANGKSKAEQLAELAKLKESGVLTEDEFEAEKKKILGQD